MNHHVGRRRRHAIILKHYNYHTANMVLFGNSALKRRRSLPAAAYGSCSLTLCRLEPQCFAAHVTSTLGAEGARGGCGRLSNSRQTWETNSSRFAVDKIRKIFPGTLTQGAENYQRQQIDARLVRTLNIGVHLHELGSATGSSERTGLSP